MAGRGSSGSHPTEHYVLQRTVVGVGELIIPSGHPLVSYRPASLFVASAGDDLLTGYVIESDGSLTRSTSAGTPNLPNSLTLLPWGTQALVSGSGVAAAANLGLYTIDPRAGAVQYNTSFGDPTASSEVIMEPSEQWALQSDSSSGTVNAYTTLLSPGNNSWQFYGSAAVAPGSGPMAMLPVGVYLFVADQGANEISVFMFGGLSLGGMLRKAGSPYAVGAKPIALAADPMSLYLYVVCDDRTLRVYSIDPTAGGYLKQVASAALVAIPTSVAAGSTGRVIYVGDVSGTVSPFALDPGTGTLAALSSSAVPAAVSGLSLESSGQFAYVLAAPAGPGNSGALYGFKVNPDGTLTSMSTGPWLSNQPSAIAFTDTFH